MSDKTAAKSKIEVKNPENSDKIPKDDAENSIYLNSAKIFKPTKTEDYGSFFYSERSGNEIKSNWYDKFFSYGASRELLKKSLCEQNVKNCIEKRIKSKLN